MLWIKFSRKKASTCKSYQYFMRDLFELMLLLQQQRRCLYFSVLRIFFFFPLLFLCSFRCVINIDNIRSTNTFRSARQYIIYIFPSCTFKILNTDWILYEGVEIFIAFFLVRVIILPPALFFGSLSATFSLHYFHFPMNSRNASQKAFMQWLSY